MYNPLGLAGKLSAASTLDLVGVGGGELPTKDLNQPPVVLAWGVEEGATEGTL